MRYNQLFTQKRLWVIFISSMLVMFSALLFLGNQIYHQAPPIPVTVELETGDIVFSKNDIEKGQNVWQSLGGMEQGSIWGHGSYLAPDWSADWLHREATALLNIYSIQRYNAEYKNLDIEKKSFIKTFLQNSIRKNTYNKDTGKIIISSERFEAIKQVSDHFSKVFRLKDDTLLKIREQYALPSQFTIDQSKMQQLNAFFFWTAWSTVTNRPNDDITYTSNWPHDPLIQNIPTASVFLWSIVSVFFLLAGVGLLVWYYAKQYDEWQEDQIPLGGISKENLLKSAIITPSMKATKKYFWTVMLLMIVQMILGIITAHYGVEGQNFYGYDLSKYFPYSVTRTWHVQLAILWIVTSWLATGLYVAPLISKYEPKYQHVLVNFLYVCLFIIVVGSLAGEWLGINQFFYDLTYNFWFGHQGYEYIDLGRFWQIFLFIGLLLWLYLVVRALAPALKLNPEHKSLMHLLIIATATISLLNGAGLMWGQNVNFTIMEYWRWWVVHLWVEGIFEVFATAVIAILFVKMGLVRAATATISVLLATIIFLSAGVLGMFHHLYWSGTPIYIMAIGGVFSALEVVPLMVVGFEAYNTAKIEDNALWAHSYYWPMMFFAAVLFWNFVGAGLFGFLINPPIALYYMQGLYTTAVHAHTALFGVYGMLGIGLMLFCLRGMIDSELWNSRSLKISFWCLNIGLAMMTLLSLLPQGLWQAYNSFTHGYWYARSPEIIHGKIMEALVWARVPGDIVFFVGILALAVFMSRLFLGTSILKDNKIKVALNHN